MYIKKQRKEGTLVQLSVQEVPTIENFLLSIGMEELVKIFEKEMIDFETLPEITHEDLVSIGVKAFGQRHKIIKEGRKEKTRTLLILFYPAMQHTISLVRNATIFLPTNIC